MSNEQGSRLQNLMNKACINQVELAGRLGVTKAAVNQWLSGSSGISKQRIKELSDLFGCDTDYLLCRAPEVDKKAVIALLKAAIVMLEAN